MPHLIVLFSAVLVILAIFLILIKKTKLVQNPENRQFARFLLVFIFLTYSYNLCLHFSNFSLYLKVKMLPPVEHLPNLEITLSKPIGNGYYRVDGIVESLTEHSLDFQEEFSPGIPLISMKEKGSASGFGEGNCISTEVMGKKIVSVAWLGGEKKMTAFIAAHEEMHAVQELDIREAYLVLTYRFAKKGYEIDFGYFDSEQQANLAAILLMLEKGDAENEIKEQCSLAAGGLETWEKLQSFKKKSPPRKYLAFLRHKGYVDDISLLNLMPAVGGFFVKRDCALT